MDNVILVAGLACLIAAIVGGGLKAFGVEVPVLSSIIRQAILGVVGVVLIVVGISQQRPSNPSGNAESGKASTANPGSKTLQPQNEGSPVTGTSPVGGPISVNANTDPRTIAPGGKTQISVLARASDGSVIPQARVVLSAGGGVFEGAGTTEVVGQTDEQGIYHAVWKTYEPAAYTGDMSYQFEVRVMKDGFQEGHAQIVVFIKK